MQSTFRDFLFVFGRLDPIGVIPLRNGYSYPCQVDVGQSPQYYFKYDYCK